MSHGSQWPLARSARPPGGCGTWCSGWSAPAPPGQLGEVPPKIRGVRSGRGYWVGLGEGQRSELLTGSSGAAHGLPDAVGVEGDHGHFILRQWVETLQPYAGLPSWDAHLPGARGHFILPSRVPALHLPLLLFLPLAVRLARAAPALSEECTGPCSRSQGHWPLSTVLSGTGCRAQTAPGLGGQRACHQLEGGLGRRVGVKGQGPG